VVLVVHWAVAVVVVTQLHLPLLARLFLSPLVVVVQVQYFLVLAQVEVLLLLSVQHLPLVELLVKVEMAQMANGTVGHLEVETLVVLVAVEQ
jgi:hypothetical protein